MSFLPILPPADAAEGPADDHHLPIWGTEIMLVHPGGP